MEVTPHYESHVIGHEKLLGPQYILRYMKKRSVTRVIVLFLDAPSLGPSFCIFLSRVRDNSRKITVAEKSNNEFLFFSPAVIATFFFRPVDYCGSNKHG